MDKQDQPSRRDLLRATQLAKYDQVFTGRTWDIVRTVSLPKSQCFYTPFGQRCRSGYVLRDRASGEKIAVGAKLLKLIHSRYLGVTLPKRIRVKDQDWAE